MTSLITQLLAGAGGGYLSQFLVKNGLSMVMRLVLGAVVGVGAGQGVAAAGLESLLGNPTVTNIVSSVVGSFLMNWVGGLVGGKKAAA